MNLIDVSLSKTVFFLQNTETSGKRQTRQFWKDFKNVVSAAETAFGEITHAETDYRSLDESPYQQGQIVPIISSPWSKMPYGDLLGRFIARVFLDIYSLQLFICVPGKTGLDNFAEAAVNLRAEFDHLESTLFEKDYSNRLGSECLCFWIELDPAEDADSAATPIFDKIFGTLEYQTVSMSYAVIAMADRGEHNEFCIIVKNVDKSTELFNDVLPEYFLSWSKVKNEELVIKASHVETERETLNKFFGEGKYRKRLSLSELEQTNLDLSEKRMSFAEKLLDVEFHMRTLEINISNAEKLLNNSVFSEAKEELSAIMVKPLKLVAEQTQAYISYYNIILERSKIAAEKVANDANLKSAIYSRRLSFLFGLLSLIGILQLFPESFGKIDDNIKGLILWGVIVLFIIVAFNNEIRAWFKR